MLRKNIANIKDEIFSAAYDCGISSFSCSIKIGAILPKYIYFENRSNLEERSINDLEVYLTDKLTEIIERYGILNLEFHTARWHFEY